MNDINKLPFNISDRYLLINIIDKKRYSIVYSAINKLDNSQVSIEIFSFLYNNSETENILKKKGIRMLKTLKHSSIPQYIDYFKFEMGKSLYFCVVQESVVGKSLEKLITAGWQPSKTIVTRITEQILDIIIYLQDFSSPVIHQNINPQNVIYQLETGQLFLINFNIVQDYYHAITNSSIVRMCGYTAPEQYHGNTTLSTDLYGLGCTLLFLLTKRSPANFPQYQSKINFRFDINLEKDFIDWIEKLIEPEARNRFNNAKCALNTFQGNETLHYKYIYKKPKFSSVSIEYLNNELIISIPPAILWDKYSISFCLFLIYIIFILLNSLVIFFSTSIYGCLFGIGLVLELFLAGKLKNASFILKNLILIYIFSSTILIGLDWRISIHSLLILLDSLFMPMLTTNLVKELLFFHRIKINSNYFLIRSSFFLLNQSRLVLKKTKSSAIIIDKSIIIKNILNYKFFFDRKNILKTKTYSKVNKEAFYIFGLLLSLNEKKWIQSRIKSHLNDNL